MKSGPGKFEACGNYSKVVEYLYNGGTDDEIGECEHFGWYGRFAGKIKGFGPFFAIVSEDSQGFVDVEFYDNEHKLDQWWDKIAAEYAEFRDMEDDC